MNKPRRRELEKALDLIARARDIIEQARDEEQEAFDNLPESIQDGEQGGRMSEFIDILENACDELDEIGAEIEDDVINT